MLDDRIAIVTGASQGIGRTIAITLASAGADVVLCARSDGIYETAERIESDGVGQAEPIEMDVTSEADVEDAIAQSIEMFGGLDCVVNNAGIAGPTKPIEAIDRTEWERTMNVNVTGMYLMVKYAVPHLRDSDHGRIINISSISGKRPLENRTPYTASKMAVIGLTRTLAFELGDDGITVNAICPGATAGPRIEAVIEQQAERLDVTTEEARRRVFTDETALGAMVNPTDTADMIAYLVSDEGRHITAQDINVDAGTTWY